MAKDSICVFCGQRPGTFRSTTIQCGDTWQFACKACEKELKVLDEVELCRRALVHGIAEHPDRLRDRITLIEEAENHRPKCLRCGGKLLFMKVKNLDDSPNRDTVLRDPFRVLPAYCEKCGKYEFYHPQIVNQNKYLVYLNLKDTQE